MSVRSVACCAISVALLVGCELLLQYDPVKHRPPDAGAPGGMGGEQELAGTTGSGASGAAGYSLGGASGGGDGATAGPANAASAGASGGSSTTGPGGAAEGGKETAHAGEPGVTGGAGGGSVGGSDAGRAGASGDGGTAVGGTEEGGATNGTGGIQAAGLGGDGGTPANDNGGGGAAGAASSPCGAPGPSCAGGLICDEHGTSCCESLVVEGGSYERAPGQTPSYPATVSSFCLDKYEVTVGRFRKFVEAYDAWRAAGHPGLSEGSHPRIGAASGWQTEWTAELPTDAAEFEDANHLNTVSTYKTWRDFSGTEAAERLPVNFVSWYEAFAFCIWDGGRLPTEAEWQHAAQGGSLNREYPWGDEAPTSTRAVYDCMGDGSASGDCAYSDLLPVGSKPEGKGYWQQSDLAGSMWEWNLDWYGPYSDECNDCVDTDAATYRMVRGGGWHNDVEALNATYRSGGAPTYRHDGIGLRCARTATSG